jgi:hypothetical protein
MSMYLSLIGLDNRSLHTPIEAFEIFMADDQRSCWIETAEVCIVSHTLPGI